MNTTISLSPGQATKARRTLQTLALSLSRLYQRWACARRTHATVRALDLLDDGVLRDLGLDRSELLSAAAELHGLAEHERRQTLLGTLLPR